MQSEFNTKPRHFITHDPSLLTDLSSLNTSTLRQHHFLATVDADTLQNEFDQLVHSLRRADAHTIELLNLVGPATMNYLRANPEPNLMFTRDPAVTLPWDPSVFIPANFSLPARRIESSIMSEALTNLGLKPIGELHERSKLEGGDVIPIVIGDQRTLIIGLGARTNLAAAEQLYHQLFPKYLDSVIVLEHSRKLLHLDTTFNIISAHTAINVENSFRSAYRIERSGAIEIKAADFFKAADIKLINMERNAAVKHETCNVLPLGDGQIVSFDLPKKLEQILRRDGLGLHEIIATELPKAAGGVHCLTRPVY